MIIKGVPLATKKRSLVERIRFHEGRAGAQTKPSPVEQGAFFGWSFPVYNSDDEELFGKMLVPGRWDGTTNITVTLKYYLAAGEDVGDKFKFQFSWNVMPESGVLPSAVLDVEQETVVATSRNAQYSVYEDTFTLDVDNGSLFAAVTSRDTIGFRVRRIASGSPAVSGEIVLIEGWAIYTIDKAYTA